MKRPDTEIYLVPKEFDILTQIKAKKSIHSG